MSDTDSNVGLRDAIEASYASHTPSPDIDSIVSNAREERSREISGRDRDKGPLPKPEYEARNAENRRAQLRAAFREESAKAAQGNPKPSPTATVAPGAPATWDQKAKQAFNE